jgi:hypothetical protein
MKETRVPGTPWGLSLIPVFLPWGRDMQRTGGKVPDSSGLTKKGAHLQTYIPTTHFLKNGLHPMCSVPVLPCCDRW